MFLDVHSLLEHKKKKIAVSETVMFYFKLWKSLRKDFGNNEESEVFIAGYIIGSNSVLKEKFLREKHFYDIRQNEPQGENTYDFII